MRFKNMPGWTKKLMSERKFRKAVIRAAKFDHIEIVASWDKGNAWQGWENGPRTDYAWKEIPCHGMHSQMPVPVAVRGFTGRQPDGAGKGCLNTEFHAEGAAWISFWNWED